MQNKIIIVIGPKGSGKTRQVSILIDKLERVAIFDMVRDSQYFANKDGVVVINGNPREFSEAISQNKQSFKVIYHPSIYNAQENGLMDCPAYQPVVKLCHERGDMWLVTDEAHLICNSRNCPPELMRASLIGRHQKFSMILIAQSFTGIHPAIRKNVDEMYIWKIVEPSDLDGVEDRCGRDVRDQVAALRAVEVDDQEEFKAPGQMLHWSKFRGVVEVTK